MNSFVFSKLYYCSTVWSNTSKHNINKLQLVQNFAARVVLGLKKFDHISQAIKSQNWLPVNDRIYLNDAVMMYKCINKLVPDYLIKKFTLRSQTHTRNTRQYDQLNIPRCRLTTGQRSFTYRGAKLWNQGGGGGGGEETRSGTEKRCSHNLQSGHPAWWSADNSPVSN